MEIVARQATIGPMTARSRWPAIAVGSAVVLVAVAILLGVGFTSALPELVGGQSAARNLVVTQPTVVPYAGPRSNEGYDVSFPQCGSALPDTPGGFAIVGINGGRPFKDQECFPEQIWWAQQQNGFAIYANTEFDGVSDPVETGRLMAEDVVSRMSSQYLPAGTPVWLDVEIDNMWRGTTSQHRDLIEAMANRLTELGHPVGAYSAPKLWREITGGVDPGMPTWLAIGPNTREAAQRACDRPGFGGREPAMVQWIEIGPLGEEIDHNLICPGVDPSGLLMPVA